MRNLLAIVVIALPLTIGQLSHAEIYKTVDKDGNISFSDMPSSSQSETIEPPNPNTMQSIDVEKLRQMQPDGEELRRGPTESNEGLSKSEAKKAIKQAQRELDSAKIYREGDKLFTKTSNGGFTRDSPQYKQRVADAEARLDAAKQALKALSKQK